MTHLIVRETRARERRAVDLLVERGYKRALAPALILAVKDRGLTSEELVQRAEAKAAADATPKPARHK